MTCEYDEEKDKLSEIFYEVDAGGYVSRQEYDDLIGKLEDAESEFWEAYKYAENALFYLRQARDCNGDGDMEFLEEAMNYKGW